MLCDVLALRQPLPPGLAWRRARRELRPKAQPEGSPELTPVALWQRFARASLRATQTG